LAIVASQPIATVISRAAGRRASNTLAVVADLTVAAVALDTAAGRRTAAALAIVASKTLTTVITGATSSRAGNTLAIVADLTVTAVILGVADGCRSSNAQPALANLSVGTVRVHRALRIRGEQ
jgi:hypothetical protein